MIQILLADDNEFVRTALVELSGSTGDITVVAECEDGDQVLAAVRETTPNVVVLDLAMPRRTGPEAARVLLSVDPGARIILLTGNPSPAAVREAKEIGLPGYLLKGEDPAELVDHVRTVAAGGTAWSQAVLRTGDGETGGLPSQNNRPHYGERRRGPNLRADPAGRRRGPAGLHRLPREPLEEVWSTNPLERLNNGRSPTAATSPKAPWPCSGPSQSRRWRNRH